MPTDFAWNNAEQSSNSIEETHNIPELLRYTRQLLSASRQRPHEHGSSEDQRESILKSLAETATKKTSQNTLRRSDSKKINTSAVTVPHSLATKNEQLLPAPPELSPQTPSKQVDGRQPTLLRRRPLQQKPLREQITAY
ncbi:hypothetical protein TRVL_01837 [Trypanosoma vivax]|nr:hypothetical protein TRVL_01837 [Trypanosoma vivax]